MSKYIIDWDSFYVRSCRHEDAERYGDGLYCVYFWEDDDCNVFYVGSGKGYRFNSVNEKARSAEFMEWIRTKQCRPRIAAYGMTKEESLEFEKRLISEFWKLGFPLVNITGIKERELEAWGGVARNQPKLVKKYEAKSDEG